MKTSIITMDDMKQDIKETMKHSSLELRIDIPAVDDEKLFMLLSLMNHTTLADHIKKRYMITIMLIQTALDVHDKVPIYDYKSDGAFAEEDQLTVLAGDYYSGLYYYILSEIDDYLMIRELASVIRDINESKMALYYDTINTIDDYIKHIKHIETPLFSRTASYVGQMHLAAFIEEWILIHRLLQIKNTIGHNNEYCDLNVNPGVNNYHDHNEWFLAALDQYIEHGLKYLKRELPYKFDSAILESQTPTALYHDLACQNQKKEEG